MARGTSREGSEEAEGATSSSQGSRALAGAHSFAFSRSRGQQRIMPRAPGAPARPQGVYVVDSTGQLVPQEEQGAESGAPGGEPGSRSRRGSQQRARDIVREGIEDLKTWGKQIVAETQLWQARRPTSCTRRSTEEDGGAAGQSQGQGHHLEQRVRDSGGAESGASSTWLVRALPSSILGMPIERKGRPEQEQTSEEERARRARRKVRGANTARATG